MLLIFQVSCLRLGSLTAQAGFGAVFPVVCPNHAPQTATLPTPDLKGEFVLSAAVLFQKARLRWQPMSHWPAQSRPVNLLATWLQDSGSLTARLIDLSEGDFQVKVLRQQLAIPSRDEQQILGMKHPVRALIREVVLMGAGHPWVFARSLLPITSLCGPLRHLRKQNTRPLGAFLFSQPHLERSDIQIARIGNPHAYVPTFLTKGQELWGRRSVFYLESKPLLVSEVFLPEFCEHIGLSAQKGQTQQHFEPALDKAMS